MTAVADVTKNATRNSAGDRPIVLFGGAFDPVHVGHVAMVDWALAQEVAWRVIIMPCYRHPFAKPMAPYADRLQMCEQAFAGWATVEVSNLEEQLGSISYTANTIRALQEKYPNKKFALLVGADAAATVPSWHDGAWLMANVPLIVIPRGSASHVPDVASSQVRAQCARQQSITGLVPPPVEAYIEEHALYR